MALSENRRVLKRYGDRLLGPEAPQHPALRQLQLWCRGNRRAAEDGKRLLGKEYFMVRYEDLCRQPEPTLLGLLRFLDGPEGLIPRLLPLIRPSSSIGRWTKAAPRLLRDFAFARADLAAFGYR
jgi:hypothetical protein